MSGAGMTWVLGARGGAELLRHWPWALLAVPAALTSAPPKPCPPRGPCPTGGCPPARVTHYLAESLS